MNRHMKLPWAIGAALLAGAFALDSSAYAGTAGRYKKDGARCVWDANDSGPNQCAPVTAGHFRRTGNTCVWDSGATGNDQCRPAKGRFKKEGSSCVWNGSDSGPDQCDPHAAK